MAQVTTELRAGPPEIERIVRPPPQLYSSSLETLLPSYRIDEYDLNKFLVSCFTHHAANARHAESIAIAENVMRIRMFEKGKEKEVRKETERSEERKLILKKLKRQFTNSKLLFLYFYTFVFLKNE